MLSNILTREKLMTSINTEKILSARGPSPNRPLKSNWKKEVSAKSENLPSMSKLSPSKEVTPRGMPTRVETTMPRKIEPRTFLMCSTAMVTRPTSATSAPHIPERSAPGVRHWEKSTRLTKVASLLTTRPLFFRPMMVINRPTPGVTALMTELGMERMMASRRPILVMTIKKTPEINTTARDWE